MPDRITQPSPDQLLIGGEIDFGAEAKLYMLAQELGLQADFLTERPIGSAPLIDQIETRESYLGVEHVDEFILVTGAFRADRALLTRVYTHLIDPADELPSMISRQRRAGQNKLSEHYAGRQPKMDDRRKVVEYALTGAAMHATPIDSLTTAMRTDIRMPIPEAYTNAQDYNNRSKWHLRAAAKRAIQVGSFIDTYQGPPSDKLSPVGGYLLMKLAHRLAEQIT